MQPVGQHTPVVIEALVKSRLEKLPIEVKLLLLKCLGNKDISQTGLLNKSWQKVESHKQVWTQVAKQLEVPAPTSNNPKQEVLNSHYGAIGKALDTYLSDLDLNSTTLPFKQAVNAYKGKDPKEKYAIFLNLFNSNNLNNFTSFLDQVFHGTVTPEGIRAIKQFVEDGVLESTHHKIHVLYRVVSQRDTRNQALFEHFVNKIKGTPNDTAIFSKALEDLALNGPEILPILKILTDSGARPTFECLINAAESIEKQNGGTKHLDLLLDYCEPTLREKVLKDLQRERNIYFPRDVTINENRKNSIPIFQAAPPPTFGKQRG